MQQKKFLLFDTRVGLSSVDFISGSSVQYGNMNRLKDEYTGENATATGAMDLAGLGGGFSTYDYGDDTGSDLVQNGTFDEPVGGVIWTNNNTDANDGATFGVGDFDTSITSANNGRLLMRTYSGTPTAPYVAQNITVGSSLNFNVRVNWSVARDYVTDTGYYDSVLLSPTLPSADIPAISIAGVTKSFGRGRSSVSGQVDNYLNERIIQFTKDDFIGLDIQPGDTVEIRLQMRSDITGTNTGDYEFGFDSIEVFEAEQGFYAAKLFTNYEEEASIGFEGVTQPTKVVEDLTTIFDAFSEAGSNFNRQPSFVRASDLDLNATTLGMTPHY